MQLRFLALFFWFVFVPYLLIAMPLERRSTVNYWSFKRVESQSLQSLTQYKTALRFSEFYDVDFSQLYFMDTHIYLCRFSRVKGLNRLHHRSENLFWDAVVFDYSSFVEAVFNLSYFQY